MNKSSMQSTNTIHNTCVGTLNSTPVTISSMPVAIATNSINTSGILNSFTTFGGNGNGYYNHSEIDYEKINSQAKNVLVHNTKKVHNCYETNFDISLYNLKIHFGYWAMLHPEVEDVVLSEKGGRRLIGFLSEASQQNFLSWIKDYKKRFYGSIVLQKLPTKVPPDIELMDKSYFKFTNDSYKHWIWIVQNTTNRCWFRDNTIFFDTEEDAMLYKLSFT